MPKYKTGDYAFVAHASGKVFKATLSKVEEVFEGDSAPAYRFTLPVAGFVAGATGVKTTTKWYPESEVFDTREQCDDYIDAFYGYALCNGCEYEDADNTFYCNDCVHAQVVVNPEDKWKSWLKCGKRGVRLTTDITGQNEEICPNFRCERFPQTQTGYGSWDRYQELLINCLYNKECDHHALSCHVTCSYDHYRKEMVRVPLVCKYDGQWIEAVLMPREEWWNDDNFKKDAIRAWGVRYWHHTSQGKTEHHGKVFDEPVWIPYCFEREDDE